MTGLLEAAPAAAADLEASLALRIASNEAPEPPVIRDFNLEISSVPNTRTPPITTTHKYGLFLSKDFTFFINVYLLIFTEEPKEPLKANGISEPDKGSGTPPPI